MRPNETNPLSTSMPRALTMRPQATAGGMPRAMLHANLKANGSEPKMMLAELAAGVEDFKANYNGKFEDFTKGVQATMDEIATRYALKDLGGFGGLDAAVDPEYTKTFAGYMRSGFEADVREANLNGPRSQEFRAIQAAMQSGTGDQGGYLAPTEWDRRINKALQAVSPMRRICDVRPTKVRAYSTLWSLSGWGSAWVGETAVRPATSTPTLQPVVYTAGEIFALPFVTQGLLDDADFDLAGWLEREVVETFGTQEDIAFVAGDGANKPTGFLTYAAGGANAGVHPGGALVVVPTGQAAALGSSDSLLDFVYSHPAQYRQDANWLMNSATAGAIAKMKDGQGNYLWRETYVAGQPATLLGYPVVIDENMPTIAAGNLPIAFGNFKLGYVINDRASMRLLRDPYTNKPYVGFYATKRVGGGVQDPRAIRVMRVAAS